MTDQWEATGLDTCVECGAPTSAHCGACYLPEPYRPAGRTCDWCPAADRPESELPERTDP